MNKLLLFLGLLLIIPIAQAQSGHMPLLAVSDTDEGRVGGVANLFLEIKPGTGRVFLETFPLTRIDTQISTRFAKEIACSHAEVDCNQYDFFYTITADSAIIAGPSAGAAITVLTFSLITNTKIDEKTVITGTINSGGLIGPVGGIKEKVEAASKNGFKKVLIPSVESDLETNGTNESLDAKQLEKLYKIKVVQVPALDEALFEFTGKEFKDYTKQLEINQNYKDTMRELAVQLCSRSSSLQKDTQFLTPSDNVTSSSLTNAKNLTKKGKEAFDAQRYYSAASYCFGSNVEYNFVMLSSADLSDKQILSKILDLREQIKEFDRVTESEKIQTITDLEAYMVVKERLIEASDFLDKVSEGPIDSQESLRNIAYATERVNSAHSWSQFIQNKGKQFDLNEKVIKAACMKKINEVEERLQYVQMYVPQEMEATRKELKYAYDDLQKRNYELCLFRASKAKANVDTILSVFGITLSKVDQVIAQKYMVVQRNLIDETQKGIFPILGYSYYEYADSLRETDPFSSLLYLGYALELSDLDIYFDDTGSKIDTKSKFDDYIDANKIIIFALGLVIGLVVASVLPFVRKRKESNVQTVKPVPKKGKPVKKTNQNISKK